MSEEPTPSATATNPAPEALETQESMSGSSIAADDANATEHVESNNSNKIKKRRTSYRPSHKATFVGLAVVAVILAINAVVISFLMKQQTDVEEEIAKNSVTLSSSTLDSLGVSRNPVGDADTELVIGPSSTFNGRVKMGGEVTIAGQLILNDTLSANDATLVSLQAGDTNLQQLNVNGDGTISTLNLRQDLRVAGAVQIQGQMTVNQLTTINNSLNVAGNVAIGGALSVRDFQVGQLTVTGHLISSGNAPNVSRGGGTGSNGTVSISGNDTSGTVAVNTGVGAGNGLLATVSFAQRYGSTPHVLVTPIGRAVPGLYVNRTADGFTISVEGTLSPGGYAFDYFVVQ
ncbi:hypothetical protein EOL96_00885 [Candidatus Saccharibacteria bacterium]|nr:hypothetical protein [Candidatus Saccharibacteria bacterium]